MTESLRCLIRRAAASSSAVTMATETSAPGAAASSGVPRGEAEDALTLWVERVAQWNARIDLTAARTPEEFVDLLVADAMFLSTRIPIGARLVDVGSGAGSPGLALALLRPDLRSTLVEPLGKRASFLMTVAGLLGRRDLAIERVRGEALRGHGSWDVAVSRATLSPKDWVALGAELTSGEGSVWVFLAKGDAPEHPSYRVAEAWTYTWPLTGVPRRALRYCRGR